MSSLNNHFQNYLNECEFTRRLRPETIRSSKYAFEHFTSVVPEVSEVSDISTDLITVFFKRLQTRERIVGKGQVKVGIKDSTVASYTGRLRAFFQWLKNRKIIEVNPFETFRSTPPVFADHRALTGGEIKKIMGTVAQYAKSSFLLRRDMAMVGILTFCGLRRNELASLEVRDIELLEGFIIIRPETSKSKAIRKIPVNVYLRRLLKEYLEERKKRGCKTEYLFVSYGADKPLTLHGLKHWVEKLSKLSGVKFHLHRFRHTFATNLAMQDVGVVKIQKLMGHKDIKMTQTYLRSVSTEDMQDDINKLSFENLA